MSKSQISRLAITKDALSLVSAGTYLYPTAMRFNDLGTMISITTSSGASINQILGNTGSIVVSSNTGNVVVGLDTAGTSGTYNNVFSLNIDDRGRVRSISTFTNVAVAGTYTGVNSISVDGYGRINNVTTGNFYVTSTNATLYNSTLTGLTTFYSIKEITSGYYPGSGGNIDLTQGITVWYANTGFPFTLSFTNVPLVTNAIVTTSVIYDLVVGGSYLTTSTRHSVNGNPSWIYWANNQYPPGNGNDRFYTFSFLYDGSTSTIYASFTDFYRELYA
jgi:hypothetical protein